MFCTEASNHAMSLTDLCHTGEKNVARKLVSWGTQLVDGVFIYEFHCALKPTSNTFIQMGSGTERYAPTTRIVSGDTKRSKINKPAVTYTPAILLTTRIVSANKPRLPDHCFAQTNHWLLERKGGQALHNSLLFQRIVLKPMFGLGKEMTPGRQ